MKQRAREGAEPKTPITSAPIASAPAPRAPSLWGAGALFARANAVQAALGNAGARAFWAQRRITAPFERAYGLPASSVPIERGGTIASEHAATRAGTIHVREGHEPSDRVLAHELAHVVQQRGGAGGAAPPLRGPTQAEAEAESAADAALRGAPMPRLSAVAPSSAQAWDPSQWHPPMLLPEDVFTVVPPPTVTIPSRLGIPLDVEVPALAGAGGTEEVVLALEVSSEETFDFFAVPTALLRASSGGAPLEAPVPGTTAYTPAGEPIRLLAARGGYAVTDVFTNFAVGAGSVKLLETPNGPVLIDAGIAQSAGGFDPNLAEAIVDRIVERLRGRPLTEIVFTHLHLDHNALMAELMARVEVQGIRVNVFQAVARTDSGRGLFDDMISRVRARMAADARADLERRGGPWDAEVDTGARRRMLDTAIDAEVELRMQALDRMPVRVLLPVGGQLQSANLTLGTVGTALASPIDVADVLSSARTPEGLTVFTDPELGARAESARGGTRQQPPMFDRFSTSVIADFGGGAQLLVLSDLRAEDLARVQENFNEALRGVNRSASFRLWDITHHMQSGFAATPANLVEATRVLHQIAASQAEPGTLAAGNAVIVSADLRLVDPATIWILRSLGFDIFLASEGADVHLLEVEYGAERFAGLVAQDYEGAAPSDALVRRAQAALASLEGEIRDLRDAAASAHGADAADAQRRLTERTALRADIEARLESYVEATRRSLRASSRARSATAPARIAPAPGAEPALAEAAALRALLTDFAQPVVGETPRLVESALIVIDREAMLGEAGPSEAGARLLERRNAVRALQARWDEGSIEARVELIAALEEYRSALRGALDEAPRGTRELLEREIRLAGTDIDALTATSETITLQERQAGTGRLIETRISRFDQWAESMSERLGARIGRSRMARSMRESRLAETGPGRWAATRGHAAIERGMHEGGRVLGSFMVYQSFAAEADLIDRLAHGEANPLEGIAGTAHNVQGISVGIRMMRGIPVRGGAFVVLGILDVTQTAASDNPADEAYWAELTYSVIRNTLQIACFYLGSAVIAAAPETGPFAPLVALVGLAIMFLADPLLELIGLRDVLNRAFAFEPGDVWDVGAELPELIAQYRVVAGALELMGRRDEELAALGVLADPADVRARARETRDATLAEAHELEEDILEELDEGYEAAETGHVGLMALDYWRREYTQLRWRAHGGTVDEAFMERMRAMEASTSMRGLDADSVRELDLWDDMDAQMGEVESELDPWGSMDWAELSVEVGNLERIFRNARYRLDPASFGELRTRPLLEPGDPGYGEYVARLEEKETAYQALLARVEQRLGASLPPLCGIPSAYAGDASALGRALASLHDALLTYDRLVRAHTPLPPELSAEILYTHSGDAGYAYTQLLETNEGYRRDLTRLQTHVGLVRERMREARRVALAQPELDEDARRELERLGEDFDRIERERQHVRGLLFPHEARALAERIRVAEVAEIGGAFGATRETPRFSEDELAALSEGALRGLDYHSLLNNLERIPALRRGGATEALGGIYCLAGPPAGTEFPSIEARLRHPRFADAILVGSYEQIGFAPRRYLTGYGIVDLAPSELAEAVDLVTRVARRVPGPAGALLGLGEAIVEGISGSSLGESVAGALDLLPIQGDTSVDANLWIETFRPSFTLATFRMARGTQLVVPLNPAAVRFFRAAFGHAGPQRVYDVDLRPITMQMVRQMTLGEDER